MRRDTLLDFFEDHTRQRDVFILHDDGYRVREMRYDELGEAARAFAARLTTAGVGPGDKVVVWSENRTEWVIALWGCLVAGAVLVPVDYRASADLVTRIAAIVSAKIVLVGEEVEAPAGVAGAVWTLTDVADWGGRSSERSGRSSDRPKDGRPKGRPLHPQAAGRPLQSQGEDRPLQSQGEDRPLQSGVTSSTLAEIIFTSGATADPKGVTITHRNVLANIIPIEREIAKYRRYVWPFHPIRFLNLLPLSHMFGQSMATFVPPILAGTVVFSHGYSPVEIVRQIKTRRISVLVCVPKVLDVLRAHVERIAPMASEPDTLAGRHWLWRWWRYRSIHRLFGLKFWCVVCGAAPLDPELEAFWRKLGFLIIQGYGLTETAPVVTLNHPFRASKGTVGTPIGGVEIKIAPDGEILVRGENVTRGYYRPEGTADPAAPAADPVFEDGWFHTGDIGALDDHGRLLIKGRKKEMIVTPQGLNVFPEDVERALVAQPGVIDAGVVGLRVQGEERIHAVLVLAAGADTDAIVRGANAHLEDHQRVWSTSIWPASTLPRTEGTQKLKRRELQRWATGENAGLQSRPSHGASVADIVRRYSAGRDIGPDTTLEELGLSSLDRVELMMALEAAFQTTLDESALEGTRTIGEIEQLVRTEVRGSRFDVPGSRVPGSGVQGSPALGDAGRADASAIDFPSWNRTRIAWFLRRISLPTWILPLARVFMQLKVEGLEHLGGLDGPVVFAANHQSHMDGPAVMIALPRRWRYWLAPAMAKEFFKAHFYPQNFTRKAWFTNSLNYYLSCQFFNAFPLPQREAGTRQTLRYIGEVLGDGYSILIFPEGKRAQDAVIGRFMPGIGMIGARLDVPIIPMRIEGLDKVLHPKMKFPKRGPVRIAFGAPLRLTGDDYAAQAKQVEDAVKRL